MEGGTEGGEKNWGGGVGLGIRLRFSEQNQAIVRMETSVKRRRFEVALI